MRRNVDVVVQLNVQHVSTLTSLTLAWLASVINHQVKVLTIRFTSSPFATSKGVTFDSMLYARYYRNTIYFMARDFIVSLNTTEDATYSVTWRHVYEDVAANVITRPRPMQPFRYCTLILRQGAASVTLSEHQQRYLRTDHKGHSVIAHGFPALQERFPERVKITVRYLGTTATLQDLPQDAWPIQSIDLGWANADDISPVTTFDYFDGQTVKTLRLKHLEVAEVGREALSRRETALANLEKARTAGR